MIKGMIAVLFLISSVQVFAETGFKSGNNFTANAISGSFTVYCSRGSERNTAHGTCQGSYLDPSNYAKFSFDGAVDADKVTLVATNSKGKKRKKSSRFNKKVSESKRSFNLWIWSLTQRPMLSLGENTVAYSLTKKGRVVESGSFEVNVNSAPSRTCRYATFYSSNMDDCRFTSNVCGRYFREQNYCN